MNTNDFNPLDIIDTGEIDTVLGSALNINRPSFGQLVERAVTGQLDLSPGGIITGGLRYIFAEVVAHISLMQQLIFVAVLAAVIKILTDSFKNKSAGELGFYVTYLVLVIIIFSSFRLAIVIAMDLIQTLTHFVGVSLPVVISLVLMSGNVTGAYVYHSLFLFAINIINLIILNVLIPLIIFVTTIQVVSNLTDNEILKNLSDIFKNIISWGTKTLAVGFISILALQRISAPILNNLAIRTARSTINAVPVVGGALSGAVDTVLYFASATKSGVIVAVIISIVYLCIIPVSKLVAIMFIYKFVAAVVQPICDKRIVKCMSTISNYSGILLGMCVMVVIMFTVALMMLVTAT